MALDTYANLTTALSAWEERTFTSGETDEAILIAEAKANRKLDQDFRRRSTSTVNTNASGVGTLPTGFVGLTSITRDVLGSVPLTQVSHAAFIQQNPYETSEDARYFVLLSATEFAVSPVTDDNFLVVISGSVPALTSSNTTNWLLTMAPDYYLHMAQAVLLKKYKHYEESGMLESMAMGVLSEIVAQGNVAEFGSAEMTLDMVTP